MPDKTHDSHHESSRAPVSQRPHTVPTTAGDTGIGAQVTVKLDGRDIKVPFGTTILEAARTTTLDELTPSAGNVSG